MVCGTVRGTAQSTAERGGSRSRAALRMTRPAPCQLHVRNTTTTCRRVPVTLAAARSAHHAARSTCAQCSFLQRARCAPRHSAHGANNLPATRSHPHLSGDVCAKINMDQIHTVPANSRLGRECLWQVLTTASLHRLLLARFQAGRQALHNHTRVATAITGSGPLTSGAARHHTLDAPGRRHYTLGSG